MGGIERGTPVFRRVTIALFLGGLVTFANLYSVQPVLPALAGEFTLSPSDASLAVSVATATLAVCLMLTAHLSDRWGRKPVMVASMLASSVLALATALSPTYGILLVVRALQGVVLAGLPASAMAYLGDEVHPASAGLAMGLYIGGTTIGGMSGRLVTGTVAGAASWRTALVVLSGICFLCSLWFWRNLPAGTGHPRATAQPLGPAGDAQDRLRQAVAPLLRHLRNPVSLPLYGVAALLMGSYVPMYNYLGFQLLAPPYRLPPVLVSSIYLVYLVGAFSSPWMGALADRAGHRRLLRTSAAIMLAGALITAGVPLVFKFGGLAVFTFGFFGGHSIASSWVARHAGGDKAHASSLYLLFYYAGASAGGWLGGVFWTQLGWTGLVAMLAVLLSGALATTLFLPSRVRLASAAGAPAVEDVAAGVAA
jgi:YNFM family putative membrane transporter